MNKKLILLSLVLTVILAFALTVSADYRDDFSDSNYSENGWHYNVLLGNPNGDYLFPEMRRISFHLPDYDTSIYLLNENTAAENSTVEATFENVFSNHASYGVVCRYHDYGWYELRVNVSGEYAGTYQVYKYDQYLKTQGKNPYVLLHPGMDRYYSYDIKLGLNVKNTLKMECEGENFRIFINGNEQFPVGRNNKLRDSDFSDGECGIAMINMVPGGNAQVDLTKFSAGALN